MIARTPKRVAVILLVSLLAIACAACQGTKTSGGVYQNAIQIARSEIWQDINSGKACSAEAAILDNGKIVYSEGFGMANRDTSTPVNTNTLFNIGSTSKTYCTAAVMKLVDAGKVKLDSPVVEYLPEFKMADPRYKAITVRMLLDHSSGLPGTTTANEVGYQVNPNFYADVLANYAHSHLKADPGFAAPYCNDGFTVAEMLVAKVSGRKYIDYLTTDILQPLGLTRTGVSVGQRPDEGIASFYLPDTGKKVPPEALSVLGAGGLSSTANELVMFGDSFSTGGQNVLSKSSRGEMMKAQPSQWAKAAVKQVGINPEEAYGLGLDAVDMPAFQKQGIKVIGKGGDTDDYHSQLMSVPAKRITVAVIEAGHGSTAPSMANDVLESVLVSKGLMKKAATPVTAPMAPQPIPAQYRGFDGTYDLGSGLLNVSFDFNNNTVALARPGAAPLGALIYHDGSFYAANGTRYGAISVEGQTVLLQYGHDLASVLGQKIPTASPPQALRADLNSQLWLRRNVRAYESMSLASGTHVVTSVTDPGLPGYVIMTGSKQVKSPVYAGMTSSALRDLTELDLLDRSGQTWAQLSEMLYSPASVATQLGTETKSVTIGKDAYNEWFRTAGGLALNFDKPSKDRAVVFGPDGSTIYDSVINSGAVYAPAGSLVELAGAPGDVLKVIATTPASN
ncbi:MAG TPA: serine hydrolase domain-containing protein [Candidatus Anoxymicrobiaceae bacterium]